MCSTALRKRREYFSSLLGRLCNRCGCSWYQFFMACRGFLLPSADRGNWWLYKAELFHRRGHWKNRESVELATLQCGHWLFNHIRVLKPIGGIPPAEAEANYWRRLASKAVQAAST